MEATRTTEAIQGYLDELAGLPEDSPAEPLVRGLLARAAGRLHQLCAALLYRSYPRLTRAPVNLESGVWQKANPQFLCRCRCGKEKAR